jgi:adenylate cyclase
MGTEVERKFLVLNESFLAYPERIQRVRRLMQGYPRIQACSLRFQHVEWLWPARPNEGRITIKSAKPGKRRSEFEYPIPAEDAAELLDRFCGAGRVWKIRVDVMHGEDVWEIDVYEDELTGLMACELEFHGEEHSLASEKPSWLGPEITNKAPYYNQNLAQHGWPPDYTALVVDYQRIRIEADRCLDKLKNWRDQR